MAPRIFSRTFLVSGVDMRAPPSGSRLCPSGWQWKWKQWSKRDDATPPRSDPHSKGLGHDEMLQDLRRSTVVHAAAYPHGKRLDARGGEAKRRPAWLSK